MHFLTIGGVWKKAVKQTNKQNSDPKYQDNATGTLMENREFFFAEFAINKFAFTNTYVKQEYGLW
jgi:hypothetical protein